MYLTSIDMSQVEELPDLHVKLSKKQRKHLILTGKNGSGKSTLLSEIMGYLNGIVNGRYQQVTNAHKNIKNLTDNIEKMKKRGENEERIESAREGVRKNVANIGKFSKLRIYFSDQGKIYNYDPDDTFFIYFDAKRSVSHKVPDGIKKVGFKERYSAHEYMNQHFLQHIVNLKAERSFARDDGDDRAVSIIDNWFETFEKRLGELLGEPYLKLHFDRKNYSFKVLLDGKPPLDLTNLSDGHTAIFAILAEIILRMGNKGVFVYDKQGVVLIDELETHLHVDLQKKILPLLNDFFPNVQFILTTHSPFVLSSVSNAVICDLEREVVTEDLSGYSYSSLVESYFGSDGYSIELSEKVKRYESLVNKSYKNKSEDEVYELSVLKKYFDDLPMALSPELKAKIQQLELANIFS